MSWAAVALAAYEAATGEPLRCVGCKSIISSVREPEEVERGVFAHPNSRCYAQAICRDDQIDKIDQKEI